MGKANGQRSHPCPFCGTCHARSNWMLRRGVVARRIWPTAGLEVVTARDTAQIRCARAHGWEIDEPPASGPVQPSDAG